MFYSWLYLPIFSEWLIKFQVPSAQVSCAYNVGLGIQIITECFDKRQKAERSPYKMNFDVVPVHFTNDRTCFISLPSSIIKKIANKSEVFCNFGLCGRKGQYSITVYRFLPGYIQLILSIMSTEACSC